MKARTAVATTIVGSLLIVGAGFVHAATTHTTTVRTITKTVTVTVPVTHTVTKTVNPIGAALAKANDATMDYCNGYAVAVVDRDGSVGIYTECPKPGDVTNYNHGPYHVTEDEGHTN